MSIDLNTIKKKLDLSKFDHTAREMFIAYASVPRLFSDDVWIGEKYRELKKGKDRVRVAMEFFYMDAEVRVALFRRFPNLTPADFDSLRRLANSVI